MLESNQNCITNPLSKEVIQQLKINISYSIRGSEIKKINVLVNGQADAEQTDFFVIKQILMKEAPELNLKKPELQYIPPYDIPAKQTTSNSDLVKLHGISNLTYEIGIIKCKIET